MDIQSAIDVLRANHTIDKPATLEQMAAACGIGKERFYYVNAASVTDATRSRA
jgi:hypothetical protein